MTQIYLNQAGTSWPKPEPVRAAVADAMTAPPEEWAGRIADEHAEVAAAFGITDPSRLLLTPGCSSALAVAISDHEWASGDRIVVSGLEHHGLFGPVQRLAARGVEAVVAPRTASASIALEAVEDELRRGGVRLVAATAACNVTGELLPVAELVALAHRYDALCLIDAAQVAGWSPLDVAVLGADLLAFAGHKGPHAPSGIGGLYVAPGVSMNAPNAACEIPVVGTGQPCAPMPGYCDVGSIDRPALAGLRAGLRWVFDSQRIHRLRHARELIARLADGLRSLPGVKLHGPPEPERRMATLALTIGGRTPGGIAAALSARGVIVSAGHQCAPLAHQTLGTAPDGVVRLSAGPANTEDDIDRTVEAMRTILAQPG